MSQFEPSRMDAKRALFEAGLEFAGVRLQLFAERLLQAADASPDASRDEVVRSAVRDIDDGALALVAEEPELRDRQLSHPAMTVTEAAETALHALGLVLLDYGRSDVPS
jgi:hypothetical protein